MKLRLEAFSFSSSNQSKISKSFSNFRYLTSDWCVLHFIKSQARSSLVCLLCIRSDSSSRQARRSRIFCGNILFAIVANEDFVVSWVTVKDVFEGAYHHLVHNFEFQSLLLLLMLSSLLLLPLKLLLLPSPLLPCVKKCYSRHQACQDSTTPPRGELNLNIDFCYKSLRTESTFLNIEV